MRQRFGRSKNFKFKLKSCPWRANPECRHSVVADQSDQVVILKSFRAPLPNWNNDIIKQVA